MARKNTVAVEVKRGRPIVYKGNVERRIVSLIKKHGASGARAILNTEEATASISMPTVLKLAQKHGVTLKRGRRAVA